MKYKLQEKGLTRHSTSSFCSFISTSCPSQSRFLVDIHILTCFQFGQESYRNEIQETLCDNQTARWRGISTPSTLDHGNYSHRPRHVDSGEFLPVGNAKKARHLLIYSDLAKTPTMMLTTWWQRVFSSVQWPPNPIHRRITAWYSCPTIQPTIAVLLQFLHLFLCRLCLLLRLLNLFLQTLLPWWPPKLSPCDFFCKAIHVFLLYSPLPMCRLPS